MNFTASFKTGLQKYIFFPPFRIPPKTFFHFFLISFINNTLIPTYASITTAFPPHFGSFFSKKHTPLSLFLETFRNVFRFPSPKSVLKTEEKKCEDTTSSPYYTHNLTIISSFFVLLLIISKNQ